MRKQKFIIGLNSLPNLVSFGQYKSLCPTVDYPGPLKVENSFWSFEISVGILRKQKIIIGLDSFSTKFIFLPSFIYLVPFRLY